MGYLGFVPDVWPGGICPVVCAYGRPNVPKCQPDGTWTDIPRCMEHEPGDEQQIPDLCPFSGYCSDASQGVKCVFECSSGPDINSTCSQHGTWEPYPQCAGDVRAGPGDVAHSATDKR